MRLAEGTDVGFEGGEAVGGVELVAAVMAGGGVERVEAGGEVRLEAPERLPAGRGRVIGRSKSLEEWILKA